MIMSIIKKVKKIVWTNQMGINQVLSLVCRSKAKEGRTSFFNANNLPGKDPAVGINGFKGVGPEWLLPKKKVLVYVLEESKIWRGREGNRSTSACPLYCLSFFLNFLSFLLCFLSYLFSFLFTLFFFPLHKNALFFDPLFRARQGPFYSACRDYCFTVLPIICLFLVWAYLPTTRSVWHSPLQDRGRFVSFLSILYFFLPRYKCFLSLLSRHAPNGTPSNLPLLGGLSSQQDVHPKIDLFPSPHHQTIPPLPLTSGPWPHHVLYWLGTGWWCLGLAHASLSDMSKSLPAAHAFAVIWRLSICVFWPFMWAFLWFPAPFRSWALYDDGPCISLAHSWFSLLPATLNYYSCHNNLILLDLFLGQPFIPFLSGLSWALFLLLLMGSYVPLSFPLGIHGPITFFGLPRPVC